MAMGSVIASSTTQETTSNSTQRKQKRTDHGKNAPRDGLRRGALQSLRNHSQHDAKLRDARLELDVDGDRAQIARGYKIRVDRLVEQGRGDSGDHDDCQQRHLKARVEKAARICRKQAKSGEADRIERAALAIQQPADQVHRDHPERALHRRREAREQRVGERCGDGGQRGCNIGQAHSSSNPEDASGDNRQMKPRHHEHMKRPRPLKACTHGTGEECAVSGGHRR